MEKSVANLLIIEKKKNIYIFAFYLSVPASQGSNFCSDISFLARNSTACTKLTSTYHCDLLLSGPSREPAEEHKSNINTLPTSFYM